MALPLAGLTAIEVASTPAAAYTGKLLAELGADVLLIEPPTGAPARHIASFTGVRFDIERNPVHLYLDAGKQSAVLDLTTTDGRVRLASLASSAGIVLHGLQPTDAATLGLLPGDAGEPPAAVIVAVTPFGLDGPLADAPWTELTISAAAGYTALCGEAGQRPLSHFAREASYVGGSTALVAILAALAARERDGHGAYVDVSLIEANNASLDAIAVGEYGFLGSSTRRSGNSVRYCNALRCSDGLVYPTIIAEPAWESFLVAIERPDLLDDPRFATWELREANFEVLDYAAQAWAQGKRAAEALATLQQLRVPSAATEGVAQLLEDPQAAARELWQAVEHPVAGTLRYPGPAWLSDTLQTRSGRAPLLGEHQSRLDPPATPRQPRSRNMGERELPLRGLRVIDLTQVWAGPFASAMLADLGADVIHIESATRPDMTRWWGVLHGLDAPFYERSAYFRQHNRGKRSLILDLARESARDTVRRLVARSDIVLNNFSRRVLGNWGLGYEELRAVNPRVIWGTMPSYGATGPWADYRSFGDALQAACGIVAHRGYAPGEPMRVSCSMTDPYAGLTMAALLLAALRVRDSSGDSVYLDLSQRDNVVRFVGDEILAYQLSGIEPGSWGDEHPEHAPHRAYRCAGDDRWVAIAVTTDDQWRALCRVTLLPALAGDPALQTATGRRANRPRIDEAIEAWTARREAGYVETHLVRAGVPAAVVRETAELLEQPQLADRGFFPWVDDPVAFTSRYPATPFKIEGLPIRQSRRAPLFGEHTRAILTEVLGLPEHEIAALEGEGAVGGVPVLPDKVLWE